MQPNLNTAIPVLVIWFWRLWLYVLSLAFISAPALTFVLVGMTES